MTLLELALGQKFQRGDLGVFRGIHPRLAGIGLVSVLAAFFICTYYNVILGWSVIYLVMSLIDPLPWSAQNTVNGINRDCHGQNGTVAIHITEE